MSLIAIIFVAFGLAMDAFTVSIAKGISLKKVNSMAALKVALFFGGFQALMPLIGYALGVGFEKYVTAIDHWIALILLCVLGGKMVLNTFKGDEEVVEEVDPLKNSSLTVLAIATSIDALAVGISFAFLNVNILTAILFIGIITFAICYGGVLLGKSVGPFLKNYSELVGGIILILIGISIFLEHIQM
ncbi:MAG TPA: manganese efflux pump MntP [Firmicutes bacterium]|nr:manganese efflux pump MntP [Bacillota bacterium]